jgi:hypothetical protein
LQFRLYIGLLQPTTAPKEATPDVVAGSDNIDSDSDDADDASDGDTVEDNQLETFLNDPELSMKIFFSSHFRERGLVW